MREIRIEADKLVANLLEYSEESNLCLLDSCGVSYLDSRYLFAGINPVKVLEISGKTADETLTIFEGEISDENLAAFFTISYDFGLKIEKIQPRPKEFDSFDEPDIFLALFDCLIVHDYRTGKTFLRGNTEKFDYLEEKILSDAKIESIVNFGTSNISTNFTRAEYLEKIEAVKEYIRDGETYQTNLTRRIYAELPENLTPPRIFGRLRKNHPAPFAAFIKRKNDYVVSISPERFFKVQSPKSKIQRNLISTSPIKGTRPRGKTAEEDFFLQNELINSPKERAENVMIVDLLRNDLGRICKFGSVRAEKICDLEAHPTFFHLVSTVEGELRDDVTFADIIKAVFPCGSITGAPKISTMRIIDEIETANRGLSMGAIGFCGGDLIFENKEETQNSKLKTQNFFDLSVAIRTMVVKNRQAIFNVGGGIVIDSIPEQEFREIMTKSSALLNSINGKI